MNASDINLSDINIIEHHAMRQDEAWIIFDADAPQVPAELRGTLRVPCVLTGDEKQTKCILAFLQAVAVPHSADSFTQPRAAVTPRGAAQPTSAASAPRLAGL